MSQVKLLFWIALFLVFYAYAGYPFLLFLVSRLFGKRVRRMDGTPSLTVIVPVHNQENEIRRKIENLLALDYPAGLLRIVISSDGSTDGTEEAVRSFADRGVVLVSSKERKGKVAAQNRALSYTEGEILVFTDATILMNRDALRKIVRAFADPDVGCVSSEDRVPGGGEGLYIRYEMFLRRLESEIRSMAGVSGSFYAVRRDLAPPTDPRFTRDFLIPLTIVEKGYRVVSDPEAFGHFLPAPTATSEFSRKTRTIMRGMDVLWRMRRLMNPFRFPIPAFVLLSHKVIRWLVPWAMVVSFATSASLSGEPFYSLLFVAQFLFFISAAAAALLPVWRSLLPGKISLFFIVTNGAILVAWIRYLRGERAVFWEPTKR